MLANIDSLTLGLFTSIGWMEMTILALLGVLIFGKRLPEVGKSIGKGIVEFKKGLAGIEDDVDVAAKQPPKIEQHSNQSVDTNATAEKTESPNHQA
jgi:sec-independent protein translocase protein TatA